MCLEIYIKVYIKVHGTVSDIMKYLIIVWLHETVFLWLLNIYNNSYFMEFLINVIVWIIKFATWISF